MVLITAYAGVPAGMPAQSVGKLQNAYTSMTSLFLAAQVSSIFLTYLSVSF